MVQEIKISESKRMAMLFDNNETCEEIALYRRGLLDLACYAASMAEENPNVDCPGHAISYAIKIARMLEPVESKGAI